MVDLLSLIVQVNVAVMQNLIFAVNVMALKQIQMNVCRKDIVYLYQMLTQLMEH